MGQNTDTSKPPPVSDAVMEWFEHGPGSGTGFPVYEPPKLTQGNLAAQTVLAVYATQVAEQNALQELSRARNAALELAQMISFGFCRRELVEDNIISEAELRGMGWMPMDDGWYAPEKFPAERSPIHGTPSTATNSGLVEIPVTPEMIAAASEWLKNEGGGFLWPPIAIADFYRAMAALAPPHRSPRPECMTDWVPAELYGSVVAERDDARTESDQLINAMRDNAVVPFFEYDNEISCLVKELDEAIAKFRGLAIDRDIILGQLRDAADQLAAKDARVAELKSELALRSAAFVDPAPDTAKPSPFREFRGDPRRMGPL